MTEGYGWAGVDTYDQPLLDAWWTPGFTAQNMAYKLAPSGATGLFGNAPSIPYVTVIHSYFDGDSSPLGGYITFMPSEGASLTQNGTTWRIPARLSGTTTQSPYLTGWGWRMNQSGRIYLWRGGLNANLMPTDLTGLVTDSGNPLYYTVIEHMQGGRKFQISVPSADESSAVDLDSLMIAGSQEPYIYDPTFPLGDEQSIDDNTGPGIPVGLAAVLSGGAVNLTWEAPTTAPTPIVAYKVNRSTTSGAQSLYATVNSGYLQYQDTGVVNGTTYYYTVQAVNSLGEYSSPSSQVSVVG